MRRSKNSGASAPLVFRESCPVPLDASSLKGLDALLATVQMPPGVPVATMGIGKAGAKNAGVLALRILALSDPELGEKIVKFRQDMVRDVEEKAKKVHG